MNKISGLKGFPKHLLDLWRFCGAFSAFSADILCGKRTAYAEGWDRVPTAPLAREMAEELFGENVDYPGLAKRFEEAI